jgi:hypothetical protein
MRLMHKNSSLGVCAALVGYLLLGRFAAPVAITVSPERLQPFRSEFRYLILSSEVNTVGGQEVRNVTVLLDDKSFSGETLRKLFVLLLARYPQPDRMFAWVKTSMEQVQTPEEKDLHGSIRVSGANEPGDKYDLALLIWQGENQFIHYYPAATHEAKGIVIKGYDPATGQHADQ